MFYCSWICKVDHLKCKEEQVVVVVVVLFYFSGYVSIQQLYLRANASSYYYWKVPFVSKPLIPMVREIYMGEQEKKKELKERIQL